MKKLVFVVTIALTAGVIGAGVALASGAARQDHDPSPAESTEAVTAAQAPFVRMALFVNGGATPGSFTVLRSRGVASVTNPQVGVFCVKSNVSGFSPGKVVPLVGVDFATSATNDATAQWRSARPNCPAGQIEIRTFRTTTGVADNDTGFTLVVP